MYLPTKASTHLIRVECLEEVNSLLEEGNHLLLWYVVGVAARLQCADASSVFSPLMLPEALVVALIVLPIRVHII